ncbi:MAG TPA: biotin/lipoyl-containing protein [bacterium]|jgi:biotin carboxyl carrier protein|nr:biotin/lipoyl-containing protein [bacterium]
MWTNRALLIAITLVAAAAVGAAGAPALLEVKSALTGVVEAQPLVGVGDVVDDGQAMVYVRTALTGSVSVAARAPRAGVVREVVIVAGQRIERGDLVARIEPK